MLHEIHLDVVPQGVRLLCSCRRKSLSRTVLPPSGFFIVIDVWEESPAHFFCMACQRSDGIPPHQLFSKNIDAKKLRCQRTSSQLPTYFKSVANLLQVKRQHTPTPAASRGKERFKARFLRYETPIPSGGARGGCLGVWSFVLLNPPIPRVIERAIHP